MAKGRDLMRFYWPNDVTGPLFEPVARRKTVDSIYRVYRTETSFDTFDVAVGNRPTRCAAINRRLLPRKCSRPSELRVHEETPPVVSVEFFGSSNHHVTDTSLWMLRGSSVEILLSNLIFHLTPDLTS